MRIADRTTARNYLKSLSNAKADYTQINERISSGKRFNAMSEDVSAGSRVLRAKADRYKVEKQLDNIKSVNEELSTVEDGLTSITDSLAELHKKIKNAQNESVGESGRAALADEIKALKASILQFANTQYGKRYVMGGSTVGAPPFSTAADGKALYNGIDVNSIFKNADGNYVYLDANDIEQLIPRNEDVYIDVGLGMRMTGANVDPNSAMCISYSGLDILGAGTKDGTPDGMPNNILNLLSEIENNLRTYDKDKLDTLDTHLTNRTDQFRTNLTDVGTKTALLDTMQGRLAKSADGYSNKIQNLMGTNDAEEATNQTMNDYVLKAILQMGATLLPVSLMDFLR